MRNKKALITIIIGVVIATSVPAVVYGYNTYNYKRYFNAGLDDFKNEKFEDAITDYNNALRYKKNSAEAINEKIAQVNEAYKSKQTYDEGLTKFNDGKFIDAVSAFQKIAKDDEKYYKMAQDKILECKRAYDTQGINNAKAKAADKNYTEAISILDTVLDFDKENQEALVLRKEYIDSVQKLKEDENNKSAEVSNKAVSSSNVSSTSNNALINNSSQYPKVIYLSNGVHIIENAQQDDGHLGGAFISCNRIFFGDQPNVIYFTLTTAGQAYNQNVPYKAVFHFSNTDYVYSGVASADMKSLSVPSGANVNKGSTVRVDFQVNYKGKPYNFSYTVTY